MNPVEEREKKKKQLANTNKQKICKLVKKAENIN